MPKAVNGLKLCVTCCATKPVNAFNRQACRPDGLNYECSACNRARKSQERRAPKRRLIKAAGCY